MESFCGFAQSYVEFKVYSLLHIVFDNKKLTVTFNVGFKVNHLLLKSATSLDMQIDDLPNTSISLFWQFHNSRTVMLVLEINRSTLYIESTNIADFFPIIYSIMMHKKLYM